MISSKIPIIISVYCKLFHVQYKHFMQMTFSQTCLLELLASKNDHISVYLQDDHKSVNLQDDTDM